MKDCSTCKHNLTQKTEFPCAGCSFNPDRASDIFPVNRYEETTKICSLPLFNSSCMDKEVIEDMLTFYEDKAIKYAKKHKRSRNIMDLKKSQWFMSQYLHLHESLTL